VLAHAGGKCKRFDSPTDTDSCNPDEEIFQVARALPHGLVDGIVAGHTHDAVAHFVGDVPVIQSYANGRAFGRMDLAFELQTKKIVARHVFPPHEVCAGVDEACAPEDYESKPV